MQFQIAGSTITLATLLTCAIIVLTSLIAAVWIKRLVIRGLSRRGYAHGTAVALGKVVRYIVVLVGLAVAVNTLGINIDAILAGSAALFVGIGLGLQSVASNFFSGIVLLLERPVKVGDFIRVGDAHGIVANIGLRATRVVTRDEVTLILPNSDLVTKQVVNCSVPSTNRRIHIGVGVEYGSDTELVKHLLLEVATADANVLDDPVPDVRFLGFGDSSLDFALLVWIDAGREDQSVASPLRFAIDAAFRAHGVTIPFPQRDLHVKSGLEPLDRGVRRTG